MVSVWDLIVLPGSTYSSGKSKPEATGFGWMQMPPHSFRVGQTVELISNKASGVRWGPFAIVRLLPNDGLDREYRVKHLADGHERVVHQSEILGEMPLTKLS